MVVNSVQFLFLAASMNKQSHSVGTQPSNNPNTPEVSTDSIKTTTPITFEVRSGTTVGTSSTTSDHRLSGTVTKSPRSSAESSLPAEGNDVYFRQFSLGFLL